MSALLRLPAELRISIYELVFSCQDDAPAAINVEELHRYLPTAALARTNHQIRRECLPLHSQMLADYGKGHTLYVALSAEAAKVDVARIKNTLSLTPCLPTRELDLRILDMWRSSDTVVSEMTIKVSIGQAGKLVLKTHVQTKADHALEKTTAGPRIGAQLHHEIFKHIVDERRLTQYWAGVATGLHVPNVVDTFCDRVAEMVGRRGGVDEEVQRLWFGC